MTPVKPIASCWFVEMFSAGRSMSPMLEIVIIHLKVGAQKKTKERSRNKDTRKWTSWMKDETSD